MRSRPRITHFSVTTESVQGADAWQADIRTVRSLVVAGDGDEDTVMR